MKRTFIAASTALSMMAGSAFAAPVELITNGGFESGTLAGWTVTDLAGGSGSWFANSGLTSPLSGSATVGAAGGVFYAVTDQTGPGTHALEQSFTVPLGASSVILSFDMFMNDLSGVGPLVNLIGLDHTAGPSQHARVDIMSILAGALSTAPIDITAILVPPSVDPGAIPNPYTAYAFDITGSVTPGGTYKIRFAETDNQLFFNQGVDNVSVRATVIPEPGTLALIALGLIGMGAVRRYQRG